MTKIIDSLIWRYATKSFDTTKKVSQVDLDEIIEAFRLTPSSFWLEPWKLIIIENEQLKKDLMEHSYHQKQVGESSHLLVFAWVKCIDDDYIDSHLDKAVKITWTKREDLSWYENMMKWYFSAMDDNLKEKWTREQVFIALWNVMSVLAFKWIDSCAIGWFNPKKYDEILGLKEKGLETVVALPIWYRSPEDKYAQKPKVRFDREQVVEIIK